MGARRWGIVAVLVILASLPALALATTNSSRPGAGEWKVTIDSGYGTGSFKVAANRRKITSFDLKLTVATTRCPSGSVTVAGSQELKTFAHGLAAGEWGFGRLDGTSVKAKLSGSDVSGAALYLDFSSGAAGRTFASGWFWAGRSCPYEFEARRQ
jgi:hypothetical protein